MDKVNVMAVIAVVTIAISLFLSLFLIGVKTNHKLSNRLFALFLVLNVIDSSVNLSHLFEIPMLVRIATSFFFFLQLPVFYLYVLSVCYSDFKLKPIHLVHSIPFLLANIIFMPNFYLVDQGAKIIFLSEVSSRPEVQFNHIMLHIQCAYYLIAAFMVLRKAKRIYLENYTGASIESINWLLQFTVALTFFFAIALLKNIFKFTDYPGVSASLKVGLIIFELIIIFWYLYKALNHPNLFRSVNSKLKLVSEIILEESNKAPVAIQEKAHHVALLKLEQYMANEKPFLDPSLTIQKVSHDLNIPVRELSVLINHTLERHFYDFVNAYRIEGAMDILKDVSKKNLTILEILYAVGFNSKSSFNTAFKKQTGKTPTEYRKNL